MTTRCTCMFCGEGWESDAPANERVKLILEHGETCRDNPWAKENERLRAYAVSASDALGSLQELLAKQLMGLADGVQCAACGVRADTETHADNCPVKNGLAIIEEVFTKNPRKGPFDSGSLAEGVVATGAGSTPGSVSGETNGTAGTAVKASAESGAGATSLHETGPNTARPVPCAERDEMCWRRSCRAQDTCVEREMRERDSRHQSCRNCGQPESAHTQDGRQRCLHPDGTLSDDCCFRPQVNRDPEPVAWRVSAENGMGARRVVHVGSRVNVDLQVTRWKMAGFYEPVVTPLYEFVAGKKP